MSVVDPEPPQVGDRAAPHDASLPARRVLVLSPWFPWPPHDGGRIRLREILRHLRCRYRVTLLAQGDPGEAAAAGGEPSELCERVELIPRSASAAARTLRLMRGALRGSPLIQSYYHVPRMARRVRELTAHCDFDVVHFEFPFLARYVSAISARCRARRVLSAHNVESLRFERELEITPGGGRRLVLLGDRLLFPHWERDAVRRFDAVVAVSDADRLWIARSVPGVPVALAPNGVDVDHFRPLRPGPGAPAVVFTGSMSYPPNVDAVTWFAANVFDRVRREIPAMRFDIVGADPSAAVRALGRLPGVRVTGAVPDVRPFLAAGVAFVAPMRSGGGTRLKILEAMAMARPVVSTAVGAEGLKATPGTDILIEDDPARMAAQVVALARSPELAERLGNAARRLVERQYDWRSCLRGLDEAYEAARVRRGA